VCLAATGPAGAEFVTHTYVLNEANQLPDGKDYGNVKVEAMPDIGEVKLTFNASASPYTSTGKHFGFNAVAFGTDLKLKPSQISVPANWDLHHGVHVSPFGKLTWEVSNGDHPAKSVVVIISGLGSNATLGHFTLDSSGKDPVYFAGHVVDFAVKGSDVKHQWVGGGSSDGSGTPPPPGGSGDPPQTPEPSALALAGLGLFGLGLAGLRRRTRRHLA
jgi:hypothetical protein